jgi:putative inorganic carbon (HCO3(-)) transporter
MAFTLKIPNESPHPKGVAYFFLFCFIILGISTSFLISTSLAFGLGFFFLVLFALFLGAFGLKNFLFLLILLRICVDVFHQEMSVAVAQFNVLSLPSALGILILALGGFYIVTRKVDLGKYPLVKPFGFFFLGCLLSLPFSEDLTPSIIEITELLSFIVLFILVVDTLRSERDIKKMVKVLVLSSFVPLFVGLFQIYSHFTLYLSSLEPFFRVKSTLTHPNAYAFYLVMITVLSVSLFLQERSEAKKIFLFGLISFLVLSLVFTYTRGAWIGLVIAIFAMGVLKKRKLLIFAPLSLYGLVLIFPLIFQRFESLLNPDTFIYTSLAWRLRLWGASIPYFFSHPVFGNGLGTFQFIGYQIDDWFAAAHNDYLRMLVETGLVGFAGYIILVLCMLKLSIKTHKEAIDPFQKYIALGFLCFLIAYGVMSFADNLFNHGGIQWYFWAYAGVVTAIYRLDNRDGNSGLQNNNLSENSDLAKK